MPIPPWGSAPGTSSGGSSPLTTKGDLFGFDSANNRVPVGANGRLLMGDSAQTLGVGYSTTTADFNNQLTTNAIQHKVINTGNPTSPYTSFLSNQSSNNITAAGNFLNSAATEFGASSTWTLNESLFNIYTAFKANSVITAAAGVVAGETFGFHDITTWAGGSASSEYSQVGGLKIETKFLTTNGWKIDEYNGVRVQPTVGVGSPQLVAGTNCVVYGVRYTPVGTWSGTISGTFSEWSFGADASNAYFNGATIFGSGSTGLLIPQATIDIRGTGFAAPTNLAANLWDSVTRTVSSGSGDVYDWKIAASTTLSIGRGLGSFGGPLGIRGTWTNLNDVNNFAVIDARPTLSGNSAGGNAYMLYFNPTLSLNAGTMPAVAGIRVFPNAIGGASLVITKYTGISSGMGSLTGTVTTSVGLDIGVTDPMVGTTIWGMQVGNYQSYHQGPLAVGGANAPVWAVDMQLANSAKAAYGINGSTTAATKAANLGGFIQLQRGTGGANWYWVMSFTNNSGTQFWTSTRADSAANPATWVTSTTAPV